MNLFVVEDEYTYYLCLYILGHEPFCCVDECIYYLRFCYVEDEYTYYLCLYILGYEPFCRGR